MNKIPIFLFLSDKNIEIIESILKNSDYSYEFFFNNNNTESSLLIIDYVLIEEKKNIDLSNFKKVICIIPKGYSNFIKLDVTVSNIVFIEFPLTYSKLIKELI